MSEFAPTLEHAIAAYNQGDLYTAIGMAQAINITTPEAEALYIESLALLGLGQVDKAAALLERELKRFESSPTHIALARHALGRLRLRQGKPNEALPFLAATLPELPANQACHLDYAEALFLLGQYAAAKSMFLHALRLGSVQADTLSNIAVCALHLQQQSDAIAYYAAAWSLEPKAETAASLGAIYLQRQEIARAEDYFRRAIGFGAPKAGWWQGLGQCFYMRRRYREAIDAFSQALAIEPSKDLHLALANSHQRLRQFEQAESHFKQAIALAPEQISYVTDLCNLYQQQKDHARAHAALAQALAVSPDNPDSRYSLGFLQLLEGNWQEGWRNYEKRWNTSHLGMRYRRVTDPLQSAFWDGKASLEGKLVMALCEQGAGDLIQFGLYCKHLVERGATVDLLAPPFMEGLMKTMPWIRNVHTRYVDIPPHDYHVSLMTMPLYEGTEVGTIPVASEPYLRAPVERPRYSDKLTIGLSWAGDPKNPYDHLRSIPAQRLRLLLEAVPEASFVTLQTGRPGRVMRRYMSEGLIMDGLSEATSFSDTAAAIHAVDLVISVCTATAHVAGAMHKPTWLLLADYADWRWLGAATTTRWYPTMRIFRQKKLGHWGPVLQDVAAAIKETHFPSS